MPVHVLVLDPSFRNNGWIVFELGKLDVPIACGVIVTKPNPKKSKLYAADANHIAAQYITEELRKVITTYKPVLVCAESQGGSKSSVAAKLMGMNWGMLSCLTLVYDLPVLQLQPTEVKKANTGARKASKGEIQAIVEAAYPTLRTMVEASVSPGSKHEHVYDAGSVFIACLGTTEVMTLRKLVTKEN